MKTTNNKQKSELMRIADLTDFFNVSRFAIWKWRKEGKLPPPSLVLGRTPFWRRDDLERFLIRNGA